MMEQLLNGTYKNATLYHVRMSFSRDMNDLGRLRLGKLFHTVSILFKVAYMRVRHNIRVLYYPPSGPNYLPMLRDMVILLCVRWMFKKTIFHFHAAGTSEPYPQLPSYLRMIYRWSYFKPDVAIRLSNFPPDDGAVFQARTQYVIPNGIEDAYWAMGCPSKPEHPIVCNILFVGMISESKGVLVLLDAIRILKENGIFVKVNVVGKFASEDFRKRVMRKVATHGLETYFDFKGFLMGQAKHEQYLNADIFCFPTFFESESFPLVVVEAMQFCVPVVVTRWRGVQALVKDGENGFMVQIQDSQPVADKIMLLLADPNLRVRMGEKGRSMFMQEYTIEKFYQRMDDCFGNLTM